VRHANVQRRKLRGGAMATASLRLEAGDGTDFVRALAPEARVFLNGDAQIGVDVGGVLGQQQVLAWYQDETALAANPLAMVLLNFSASPVVSTPYEYAPRWGVPAAAWPPKGVHLSCDFGMPPLARGAAGFVELDGTGLACEGNEKHRLCVTGGPGCDGDSVPGECSFPRASANALCAAWPACVGVTPREWRSNSAMPSSSSNCLIWAPSAGCAKPSRCAAAVMLPASTTLRK
jgi:hypothetical protein